MGKGFGPCPSQEYISVVGIDGHASLCPSYGWRLLRQQSPSPKMGVACFSQSGGGQTKLSGSPSSRFGRKGLGDGGKALPGHVLMAFWATVL